MMGASVRSKHRAHRINRPSEAIQIYAHLTAMPLAAHVSDNPHLLRLVEEAIDVSQLVGTTVRLQHDMGRNIGHSELVNTQDTDTIFFARRSKLAGYTRFVKNRKSEQTRFITIYLVRDRDGDYELTNVWIGKDYPPIPGTDNSIDGSHDFWSRHAVVYNGQSIVSNTLTKTCPY